MASYRAGTTQSSHPGRNYRGGRSGDVDFYGSDRARLRYWTFGSSSKFFQIKRIIMDGGKTGRRSTTVCETK